MSISQTSSSYYSPFESRKRQTIPAGLYFLIICRQIRMPEEHAIIVLVLINRLCEMAQLQIERKYIRAKNGHLKN